MTAIDDLCEQIGNDADAHLSDLNESTVVVGLTLQGERRIISRRSPGAELVQLPEGNSVFEIGSVSKTFLGTLLAVFEDEGLLSLDDPISLYLPGDVTLAPEIGRLTIRQLATHSSGLPSIGKIHQGFQDEELRGATAPPFGITTHYLRYRKEHLYRDLETFELAYPTGEGWTYSVMGIGTVGHILELLSGRSYEDLLIEKVCDPLGLPDTGYTMSVDQQIRIVRAYFSDGQPCPNWYHDVMMCQGGLRSTMDDMLAFAEANLGVSPLDRAIRRARETHFTLPEGAYAPADAAKSWTGPIIQGLAWRKTEGGASWHPGTTPFYQTGLAVDDERQLGLVLLSSSHDTLAYMEPIASIYGVQSLMGRFHKWFEAALALT